MTTSQTLKSIPLFLEMDDQERQGIIDLMDENTFTPGQTILHEGEENKFFHIVTSGEVEFVITDAGGNELILDTAEEGGFFGELSMLSGGNRFDKVRAKTLVKTLTLDRDEFFNFLTKFPNAAIDVLKILGQRLYKMELLLRRSSSKNVNDVLDSQLTLGQRIADGFAAVMGSWSFIIIQSFLLITWVILNITAWIQHWDPYPFILLNLALSFQAAYAAPIIMMSQNRQSDKDRLAAEIDHDVNVKAEVKISLIMSRLEDLEKSIHFLHNEHTKILEQIKDEFRIVSS